MWPASRVRPARALRWRTSASPTRMEAASRSIWRSSRPTPDIFLAAAADLGILPSQCVVIEDAQSGVQAAKAGGMACIGVARLDDAALLQAAEADWVVTSLDELPVAALER